MAIQISIADDHVILLETLKNSLKSFGAFEVVSTYSNSSDTIAGIAEITPDVLLLDLSMPEKGIDNTNLITGYDVLSFIKKAQLPIKTIVLSNFEDHAIVNKAVSLGAMSYLLKNVSMDVLVDAIYKVYQGETYFLKNILKKLETFEEGRGESFDSPIHLSKREKDILLYVAEGYSTKDIAGVLNLQNDTISDYRESLMRKFEALNGPNLICKAFRWNILK